MYLKSLVCSLQHHETCLIPMKRFTVSTVGAFGEIVFHRVQLHHLIKAAINNVNLKNMQFNNVFRQPLEYFVSIEAINKEKEKRRTQLLRKWFFLG